MLKQERVICVSFVNKIVFNGIRSGERAGSLFGLPHVAFTVQNDLN